ncbi:hypothetical protein [Chishuiella sp.]|uniref:hypothetical protein n=2 Tax=Chishuiella sp. TaxID=1969467 RepID=UPI0028AFD76D|nr:hypothetical protein [Chishuiella sp.]
MKSLQKYMIIVLAVFFTLFQSVHIFEHSLEIAHNKHKTAHNHHHKSNTKQDCQICQFHLTSTVKEKQSIENIIIKIVEEKNKVEYISQLHEYITFSTLRQRPPPTFIS